MTPPRPGPVRIVEQEILVRFRKAAAGPARIFQYPTGRKGLRVLRPGLTCSPR